MLTRRDILAAGGLLLAGGVHAESVRKAVVPPSVDHVILGVRDLDEGIAWVAERTGVQAAPGGVHPGRGTRNALLSLGERRYLEIMAPDPAQPAVAETRGLKQMGQPRVIGWASHQQTVAAVAARLRKAGIGFDGPTPGSRQRPDGRLLRWQTVNLKEDLDGVLPFFIEWGEGSVHPSEDAPKGVTLTRLVAVTPRLPEALKAEQALDLGLQIERAPEAGLHATLRAGERETEL